jgi:hypothetical protein
MTDLDQRLAAAFEQRASTVTGGVSPATVQRAVRRRRRRATTGVLAALTVAAVGVVAAAPWHHTASGGLGGTDPSTAPPGPSMTVLASLPVTQKNLVTFVSFDSKPRVTYEICESNSCIGVNLPTTKVEPVVASANSTSDAVYGLAPAGTASLMVAVGTGPFALARLVTLPVPGSPRFFAMQDETVQIDQGSVPHQDEKFKALAADGHVLSAIDVLGSVSLALRHPVDSAVVTLPGVGGAAGQYVWGSNPNWVCTGTRQTVQEATTYRAASCSRVVSPDQAMTMGGAADLGANSVTRSSWILMWVPADVTSVTSHDPGGQVTTASLTPAAGGKIALLSAENVDVMDQGVVTGLGASGQQIFSGPVNSFQPATNTSEVAGQPIDVTPSAHAER